jgi:hypothetical protein
MKKIAAITLLTVGAVALAPVSAHAGSKERAAIGGFIGGLILGHAISESHRSSCPPAPAPVVVYDSRRDDCDGYWTENRVKVWVPGHWVVRDDCGRRTRIYVAGRHEWRTERVWVATTRGGHHHHNRYAYAR